MEDRAYVRRQRAWDPDPIASPRRTRPVRAPLEADAHVASERVLERVRQRLLDDPVGGQLRRKR